MTELNSQARQLNKTIKNENPLVYDLLSRKGRAIFFPKGGILAQGQEAKGKEINATLGTALEDDGNPMVLHSLSDNIRLETKDVFPYAPSIGMDELRIKWKEKIFKKNPTLKGKFISKPVITSAITHGLSIIGYLFMDEGDEIIHANLYWGNYRLIFSHAYGTESKAFRFFNSEGRFDAVSFKETLNNGTGKKIVLLNFPNNPSGYTPSQETAMRIKSILKDAADRGNHILVIMDDAYFGLVYKEGIYQESLFAELADLHENLLAVKVDGITKENFSWGLRVGFLTFGIKNATQPLYDTLEAKTAGAIRGNISNTSHLSQSLVLKAFESDSYRDEKREKYDVLKKRFELVNQILDRHSEYREFFEPLPFNSGYFMCVRLNDLDGEVVRKTLLDRYSTGVISIDNLLRIAYSSTPTGKLEKLFDNIYRACRECKGME
ncbi:MAG: aminotransferase class I/II-fold pyridoxal phosphate-dependent enzyme [bacterium]|nr:aminotransferase class I/II-fold pyridoxal phosphate-dependent enzyme [bacterium]